MSDEIKTTPELYEEFKEMTIHDAGQRIDEKWVSVESELARLKQEYENVGNSDAFCCNDVSGNKKTYEFGTKEYDAIYLYERTRIMRRIKQLEGE